MWGRDPIPSPTSFPAIALIASASMAGEPRHIVLLGAMGVDKTTLGRALADQLRSPFLDSDEALASGTGLTGFEIAGTNGVASLHRLEQVILEEGLSGSTSTVVAAAASVVDTESGRDLIAEHFCVWVTADAEIVMKRRLSGRHRRRIGPEEAERVEARNRLFEETADLVVDSGRLTPSEAVALIAGSYRGVTGTEAR